MLSFFLTALESESDRQQFTKLYKENHVRMERTAAAILQNQGDAEDAVQNAFLQIIRHFAKTLTIPCEKLPFWCISIVKNEALMIRRKKEKAVPFEDWDTVSTAAEDISEYSDLVDLFTKLPETYRMVLEMKLLIGYTDPEIAKRLGISVSAVSTRANRGRELLRKWIQKEGLHS